MKKLTCLLILTMAAIPETVAQDVSGLASQKPFDIRGALDVRLIGYSANGMAARRSPFSYVLSGSPILNIYGIAVPFSFSYSEQQRSFSQPFNQFGMSPTYKWITVHGGYRNINFSPYTLAGHTLLGGGVELRPGKLRLGFMTGRLNRATTIDTTTGTLQPFSFSRYGTAAKIGYGTQNSYFDLSVLSAKDSEKGFKGSLDSGHVRPASNVVIGTDMKVTFAQKFFVFLDAGLSLYTRDYRSTQEIFSQEEDQRYLNFLNKIIRVNATSEYYLAYGGGLGFRDRNFSLNVAYKHVDPRFESMGSYFFQNDLTSITITPTLNALKGRLRLAGSLGIQEDNTMKQKEATTRRIIGMANISWDITDKVGLDANYVNFSSNSQPTVTLVENKYLLTQTNNNLSFSPRLILPGENTTQVLILSYNLSDLTDLNRETQQSNDITSSVALLSHTLTLNRLGLSLMSGLNYISNRMSVGTVDNYGVSLGAARSFSKVQLSTQNSWMATRTLGTTGSILNLGGNLSYQPIGKHRISLRINYLSNAPGTEAGGRQKFTETTGELGYGLSF